MRQIAITIGEMKRLQELGVDCSKASMVYRLLPECFWIPEKYYVAVRVPSEEEKENIPTFSLQDILDLLPKEIRYNGNRYLLSIYFIDELWVIRYEDAGGYFAKSYCSKDILDVAYEMLVWCLKKGYINNEKG